MSSPSCFYLYTENLSSLVHRFVNNDILVFLPIFTYKKGTCQNIPVPILHFVKADIRNPLRYSVMSKSPSTAYCSAQPRRGLA